jgi:hypothetical protein
MLKKICTVFFLVLVIPVMAKQTTPEKEAVLKTVNIALDAAAKNKPGKLESVFAPNAIILDDSPPFVWSGKGSTLRWLSYIHEMANAYDFKAKPARIVEVTKNRAYVTLPIAFKGVINQHGKKFSIKDKGCWILVLQKNAKNWQIIGAGWASSFQKMLPIK